MYNKLIVGIVILVLFTMTSCLEDIKGIDSIDNLNINPKVAFPLVDSKIFVEDFTQLLDSNFQVKKDDDGTIILNASHQVFSGTAEDYFSIPDQTGPFITISGLNSGGIPLVGTISGSGSDIITFGTSNGEKIDSIRLKGGKLLLYTFSSYKAVISATLRIPGMVINGQPFETVYNVQQGTNFTEIDLTGAWLNLTNNGSSFNELPFAVSVTITGNGFPIVTTDKLEFHCNIQALSFSELYGVTVDRVLEAPLGIQNVNFIKNPGNIDFTILEPSIKINIENSFGIPFKVNINTLSTQDYLGNTRDLQGSVLTTGNPFTIHAPTVDNIGSSLTSTILVNHLNSNISDLLSSIPSMISYGVTGSVSGGLSKVFLLDTSKVVISAEVDIPLYGSVRKIFFTKTMDFDGTIFNDVSEASLVFSTENTFPLAVSLYTVFRDSTGNPIAYILQDDPAITLAAPVDNRGISTGITEKEHVVVLSSSRILNLREAKTIDLVFLLNTTDAGTVPVRITDKDYVKVHVGIKGQVAL